MLLLTLLIPLIAIGLVLVRNTIKRRCNKEMQELEQKMLEDIKAEKVKDIFHPANFGIANLAYAQVLRQEADRLEEIERKSCDRYRAKMREEFITITTPKSILSKEFQDANKYWEDIKKSDID